MATQGKVKNKVIGNKKLDTKTFLYFAPTGHSKFQSVALQSALIFIFPMIPRNQLMFCWVVEMIASTDLCACFLPRSAVSAEPRAPSSCHCSRWGGTRSEARRCNGPRPAVEGRRSVTVGGRVAPHGGQNSESTSTNLRGLGADGGEVRGHAKDKVLDFDKVIGADAGRLVYQEHNVGLAPPTAWYGDR